MDIRKMGSMELRMCTGKPKAIMRPNVTTTVTVAMTIGKKTKLHLRNIM